MSRQPRSAEPGAVGSTRRGRRSVLLACAASVALTLSLVSGGPAASATQDAAPDGRSMASAAASCWEIKQRDPAATDGIYWLVTPALVRPDQFWCDMTTDGGGWVLIGRGREGWRAEYEGLGTAAQVREPVVGPAAFSTRQLPSSVVDGLLDGRPVDALTDGVRVRRATNIDGSTWQNLTLKFKNRDRWVWTFRARHPVTASFDGGSSVNGTSFQVGQDNGLRRLDTNVTAAQGWSSGFAYGASVLGHPTPTSHLWSATSGAGFARPFAQVYLRPRLLSTDLNWGTLPDAGVPASARTPLPETRALQAPWGVAGLAGNNGQDGEMRSEVQDFAQIGDTMYVGGNFKTVQRDAQGTGSVAQPYLAAFDVRTGEWLSSFRPRLDNQVKALAALPDGRLAVGGEFATVDGQAQRGLAVLHPATGALDTSFPVDVENLLTGGVTSLRSLKVAGGHLYLAGAFTHVTGAGARVYARSGARLSLSTGRPDGGWNPNLNGTATEVTPATDGSRVYLTGYFTTSNGTETLKMAAVGSGPGAAVIPWGSRFSVPAGQNNTFQFTVTETPSRVLVGGSEHSAFFYDRASLQFREGGISMAGGDFQTSVADPSNGLVYAGCHCDDFLYSSATTYGWPTSFTQGDRLGFVGAWDAATMTYRPEFNPVLRARQGYGAWASAVDSQGVLWVGGSFDRAMNDRGLVQFAGGFVRYAPRDVTPPLAPSGLTPTVDASGLRLGWTGVSEQGVSYEVLEGTRVVAVTTATTVSLPLPGAARRYAVRAVDAAGNRSASTPAVAFDPASVPVEVTLLAPTANWSWRWSSEALPVSWSGAGFDDGTWSQGGAPLGFGAGGLATTLTTDETRRPISIQFRTSISVDNPAVLRDARMSLVANDGAVVYLNGVEIGRKNLPAGPLTQETFATAAPREAAAVADPLVIGLPQGALVAGPNVIAVQTHLNYRSTPDASLHARLVATSGS